MNTSGIESAGVHQFEAQRLVVVALACALATETAATIAAGPAAGAPAGAICLKRRH